MKTTNAYIKIGLLLLAAAMFTASSMRADTYSWTNVQSDISGVAKHTTRRLVNPWGMASSSDSIIRVNNNGTGVSTLYHLDGNTRAPGVVTIPAATEGRKGSPTGIVSNSTPFFRVMKNGNSAPSLFIFASKDGTISGWNPTLDENDAIVAVEGSEENVYMGLTIGTANGHDHLYATNFHTGRVDVFDQNFHKVFINRFIDPDIPPRFAPFGIKNLNGKIYVTYALQDEAKRDVMTAHDLGYVDEFNTSGEFIKRVRSGIGLNAPWGLAIVNDQLWIGNFGDGAINKFNPETGRFIETLKQGNGEQLRIDGIWDFLQIGVNVYFTAGILDGTHGILGFITKDQP